MALFVIPAALKGAASFIAANGARQATKKYGPKVVKKATGGPMPKAKPC